MKRLFWLLLFLPLWASAQVAVPVTDLYFSANNRVAARTTSGAGAGEEVTVPALLNIIGSTQGQLLYRDGSAWTVLSPGTSGQALTTGGAAANPSWTSFAPAGPITTSGLTMNTARILARLSPSPGAIEEYRLSALMDNEFSSTRGSVLYRGNSSWEALGPGTLGQFLQTQGSGSDPQWSTPSGSGDVVGPGSATDNAFARFDNTTGKLIQNSVYIGDDSGNLTGLLSATISNAISATSTDGYVLSNPTAATSGNQKWSPRVRFSGQGFPTGTAASQTVDWIVENQTTGGNGITAAGSLTFSSQQNGGGYASKILFGTDGSLVATGTVSGTSWSDTGGGVSSVSSSATTVAHQVKNSVADFRFTTNSSGVATLGYITGSGTGSVNVAGKATVTVGIGAAGGSNIATFDSTGFTMASGTVIAPATGTAPTTSAAGNFAFDTNAWASGFGAMQVYNGTANTYLIGVEASDTPSNGQTLVWNTGGTITWETPSGGGSPGGSTGDIQMNDGAGGFSASAMNQTSSVVTYTRNAVGVSTTTQGVGIVNTTAATSGNQQFSPLFEIGGKVFNGSSQDARWGFQTRPVQGGSNTLSLASSVNGSYTDYFLFSTSMGGGNAVGLRITGNLSEIALLNGSNQGAEIAANATATGALDIYTTNSAAVYLYSNGLRVTSGVVLVQDSTDSTSTSTGSLVASGGVGIAKALRVGTTTLSQTLVTNYTTTPHTLAAADSWTTFTNTGASALNVVNLPTAAAGSQYTFIVTDTDGFKVVAASGDDIRISASVTATAGYIQSSTIGATVTILAVDADHWVAMSSLNTWTFDSP